ncbi:hypothetical protein NXS19_010430 [Fusarium pseudograminearum]|nr:hypothetical protein NXS19_010430 [Fusarium pseudograminearum]
MGLGTVNNWMLRLGLDAAAGGSPVLKPLVSLLFQACLKLGSTLTYECRSVVSQSQDDPCCFELERKAQRGSSGNRLTAGGCTAVLLYLGTVLGRQVPRSQELRYDSQGCIPT